LGLSVREKINGRVPARRNRSGTSRVERSRKGQGGVTTKEGRMVPMLRGEMGAREGTKPQTPGVTSRGRGWRVNKGNAQNIELFKGQGDI